MPNMKNIKNSLNQPVNKNYAAILIGTVAIALPVYGLYNAEWKNAEINTLSILLPLLWVVFVTGFIFLALGKKGKDITSEETDQKIAITYSNIQKKLTPLWWAVGVIWLIWMGYLVWHLFIKV